MEEIPFPRRNFIKAKHGKFAPAVRGALSSHAGPQETQFRVQGFFLPLTCKNVPV